MIQAHVKDLIPLNDEQRLEDLYSYNILNTPAEETFDRITQMMSTVFNTPFSFISLVDKKVVFYKSQVGVFGKDHVLRQDSFCSLTILGKDPLVIEDILRDGRFNDNPYVAMTDGLRFYAGAPLITKNGFHVGTACIVDVKQKKFSDSDKELLQQFAKMVMHEIEMRQAVDRQLRAEQELLGAYKELHFVTDTMPQLIWATEPNGYVYYLNKGWLDYTGLSFEEVKGDGWLKSIHPKDLDNTRNRWRNAVETGKAYDVEYRLLGKDMVYRWFVARGAPMRDTEGKILKWYGSTTDIHDQKAVQENLLQSKERFELVSKATQDAIWDWNLLNDEIWWNEGFKELFGYTEEEIESTVVSWYNRVHPDDKERVVGGIHIVIDNGGKQWSDEYRFRKKDGSYAIVLDRGYALHDAKGKPYRFLGSMQDVTEKRLHQQKLNTSGQRFQAAVEAVEGVLWTNNAAGQMEGEQKGWTELTGQSYEEYKGHGWSSAVHPQDAQPTIDTWMDAVKEKKTFIFEHRLKTKAGEWRLFSIKAIPIFDDDGSINEWVGVHTDITEQRRAEEKVRQSEQRFQNLVREATVGIVVFKGNEMKVEIVNESYARLVGKTSGDLLHKNIFDVFPENEAYYKPVLSQVMQTGEPVYLFEQHYSVKSAEGIVEGFLNIVFQPFREIDGNISGVMNLCQDVTQQVLSKRKIEEAEATARLAIASAELGTFEVDLASGKLNPSERLSEIFDVESSDERDRYVNALHPDDIPVREKAYEQAYLNGDLEYEGRVVRKNGRLVWIRVKAKVSFNNNDQPARLVGVVQDITEEKMFADELKRQVKERTEEIEQFTYISHHDLQEPLRKISIFVDLIKIECGDRLPELAQRRLYKVTEAAEKMRVALNDVLNYASLNKENVFVDTNPNEIINHITVLLELLISEKNAEIHVDEMPVIQAIPHQVQQLFFNLLHNALKFSNPDEPQIIRVTCSSVDSKELPVDVGLDINKRFYKFGVSDTGIGFEQQMAEKIFVMFQRLYSKEEYAGTGIGLALCKKVVTNHKGIIWAESSPGNGSSFFFILPAEQ